MPTVGKTVLFARSDARRRHRRDQLIVLRPYGGHFAALEEPEGLSADIRAFFLEFR